MIEHQEKWTAPAPLWPAAASATDVATRRAFNQPALLRFASDAFMEEFLAVLERDPARLGALLAKPETWRGPTPAASSAELLEPAAPQSSFARMLERRLAARRPQNGATARLLAGGVATGEAPLKLYQPAHQRYYLVTACFVCGLTGLPDRRIDPGQQERATFVVRRLFPSDPTDRSRPQLDPNIALPAMDLNWEENGTWLEHALVVAPSGSGWQRVTGAGASLTPGEEQLPLFAVNYTEDDGRTRRVLAGLAPVGKRETYMGAASRPAAGATPPTPTEEDRKKADPRMQLVWTQVTEPWKQLIRRADAARRVIQGPPAGDPSDDEPLPDDPPKKVLTKFIKTTREQLQTGSWYILLDFAKLLAQRLPKVGAVVKGQPPSGPLSANELAVVAALGGTMVSEALADLLQDNVASNVRVASSLQAALAAIGGFESRLEAATGAYDRERLNDPDWPSLLFPLADPVVTGPLPPPAAGPQDPDPLQAALDRVERLADLIWRALPVAPAAAPPPLAAQPVMDTREGWFVIRCVFEQPDCGPLKPPVVSAPTRPFQMAGFFDPDAPARPIRIALPLDTSPAGLRKFDKNTAFMISDILCGQIDRVKGLTLGDLVRSVLPWPFHKDLSAPDTGPCKTDAGLQAGMICSLSIPIITICALLLLMIIVSLLDIIFRWIPYFIICFPLPGFKGKKQ